MGKWETNIGNAIKNNSGGRIVIEENGVRYNKKVSVVRQVVDGIVKQVWTAIPPYTPPTYSTSFQCAGSAPSGMLTARDMFSRSQLQAALDHGYNNINVRIYWGSGQRVYSGSNPELCIGIMDNDQYYYQSKGTRNIRDDYEYSDVSCTISSILDDPDFMYGPFVYIQVATAFLDPGNTTAILTASFTE